MGVTDTHLAACEPHLQAWLDAGMHGSMQYMAKYGLDRLNPQIILPGTVRIVSVRVPYVPATLMEAGHGDEFCKDTLNSLEAGDSPYVSVYARGRDYHKVIRAQLKKLAEGFHQQHGQSGYRIAVDSAPTPEVEIARKAGLGWRGKHSLLIHPQEGSFFFLGEIFTNFDLPLSQPFESNHCGSCSACQQACPTGAIVADGVVDARKCVSYLTIEHEGGVPEPLRKALGARLYGCDDCQLVCPWNKFAKPSVIADFEPRAPWNAPSLVELLQWSETEFLDRTAGMAMRRIGYWRFVRNLLVVAGNVGARHKVQRRPLIHALSAALSKHPLVSVDAILTEHAQWALAQMPREHGELN